MDSMNMDRERHILNKHFPRTEWTISHPPDGQHKASYIAQSEEQRVFIKFDVPIDTLPRLGEIEVAPRVLASGKGCCSGGMFRHSNGRYFFKPMVYP